MTREALFYPFSLALIGFWSCMAMYCMALTLSVRDKYMKRIMEFLGIILTSVCFISLWFVIWYFQYNYLM